MNVEVREIPEEHVAKAEEYREKLIEAVVDFDEELMEKYLERRRTDKRRNQNSNP